MQRPLRIALCEDAQADADHLAGLLQICLGGKGAVHLDRFPSGEALLAAHRPGLYDAVFLDIYLDSEMTGLQAAQAIRAQDARCAIVFATVSAEYAVDSYSVRAAHYLIKPVSEEGLREVVRRIEAEAQKSAEFITLIVNRKPERAQLSDILYAEAHAKTCRVHTKAATLDTRLTIDQLAHMLPQPPFMRCHRGYIVNFDHVGEIREDFIMKNGDTVYIRQAEHGRIREAYFRHLVDKTKRGETGAGADVL